MVVRSLGDGTPAHLRNWLECIRSRQTANASLRAGHEAERAAHVANRSCRLLRRSRYVTSRLEEGSSRGPGLGVMRVSPRLAAMVTKLASELALIFRMAWPRWAFTVISLMPSSPATCLFKRPETTKAMTSRSRRVSDA